MAVAGEVAGAAPKAALDATDTRGLAILCAASVAGVYFLQPLLVLVSTSFGVSGARVGMIPMVAQVAVALGVVALLPLGDIVDNRRIVIAAMLGQSAAMLLMAWAPNLQTFLLAIGLLGFLTIAPYLIPSAASHLTTVDTRGRVTGALTKGVIVGILFARTVGGVVGAHANWRVVYGVAGGAALVVLFLYARKVPSTGRSVAIAYPRLLGSLPGLIRREPALRVAAVTQGLMFGTFGSLWIAISLHVQGEAFGMSSNAVGALGLLGLVSASIAPRSGRLIDRVGANRVVVAAIALTIAAWAVMVTCDRSLAGIGLGIVMLDIGASAAHIAKQTTLFGLEPANRTRMVAVYVVSQYLGSGLLALLTGFAWAYGGWSGVCILGLCTTTVALAVNVFAAAPSKRTGSGRQ